MNNNDNKIQIKTADPETKVIKESNPAKVLINTPLESAVKSKNEEPVKGESPLLIKIKQNLLNTDPSRWESYGSELDSKIKQAKPYDYWERFYTIEIASGVLVFRASLPVSSQYFGGGYTLTPHAGIRHYVELRPKAWSPKTLLDPYYRSSLEKDKQFKLLADGEVAKSVFNEIEALVKSFSSEKRKEILEQIETVSKTIVDRTRASKAEDWQKSETADGGVSYSATIDSVKVDVAYSKREGIINYKLILTKDNVSGKNLDSGTAKDVFLIADTLNKESALEALSKVLDDAGF